MKVSLPGLERLCTLVLRRAGLPEAEASDAARTLTLADAWGVHTHGVKNLPGYLRRLSAGGIRAGAKPRVVAHGPAWDIIDGDGALGMTAANFAMRAAIARARSAGVAYAGLGNTCHFGAAGGYAVMAAQEGLIGLAMSNDTPTVTAPGALGSVLGSNPFAFAAPVADENPLLFDIATSTVAGGKVVQAASEGRTIPLGWVVDALGRPTTDPTLWPHTASLTPMAGHKGFGLALAIEVLSAVMTAGPVLAEVLSYAFANPSLPTGHSAAFLAVNVAAMPGGAEFPMRLSQVLRQLRAAPKAAGHDRVLTPGEREWEHHRIAVTQGLDLPPDVARIVTDLAGSAGLTVE